MLHERFGTTPDEIAGWLWLGPHHGGLAAYGNPNEFEPPPEFCFALPTDEAGDYLDHIMGCWFRLADIASFQPAERFITFAALVERWSAIPSINSPKYIRRKIEESRLRDIHPIFGGTRATVDQEIFPPLNEALFVLSDITQIELEDGLAKLVAPETPRERAERLKGWYADEQETNPRGALTRTAKREGIAPQTLQKILQRGA